MDSGGRDRLQVSATFVLCRKSTSHRHKTSTSQRHKYDHQLFSCVGVVSMDVETMDHGCGNLTRAAYETNMNIERVNCSYSCSSSG